MSMASEQQWPGTPWKLKGPVVNLLLLAVSSLLTLSAAELGLRYLYHLRLAA